MPRRNDFQQSQPDPYKELSYALAQRRTEDTEEDRANKQLDREQRLQIAQAKAQTKMVSDFLETQRQQRQAAQVTAAGSLLARVNVNSLNFPKVMSMVKGKYPLAFQSAKDKQDTNLLDQAKALEDEHKQIMGFQIEQAKELGLTLDANNPGWNEKDHTIDWDKARKARETWNAQNAQKAGATGAEPGVKLAAQGLDEKGAVKYGNQQTLLGQRESAIGERADARGEQADARTGLKIAQDILATTEKQAKAQGGLAGAQAALAEATKAKDKTTIAAAQADIANWQTQIAEHGKAMDTFKKQTSALAQPATAQPGAPGTPTTGQPVVPPAQPAAAPAGQPVAATKTKPPLSAIFNPVP